MLPIRIPNHTRILGLDKGRVVLPIRDVEKHGFNVMHSAWRPNAEELQAINEGHPIILSILGNVAPPIMLVVSTNKTGE